MTLAIDRTLEWPVAADRRGTSGEPRRSWASAQPAERRGTPFNDETTVGQRWPRMARIFRARTISFDILVTFATATLVLVTVYGATVEVVLAAALGALGFAALLWSSHGYDVNHLGDGPEEFQSVLRAGAWAAGALMAVSYATQADLSRAVVFLGVPLVMLTVALARYVHRRLLHRARSRGVGMRSTLVVGATSDVARIVERLSRSTHHGFRLSGVCLPSLDGTESVADLPVVGAVADIAQVVVDRAVDVVVVAGPTLSPEALRRLSWALDRVNAHLVVVPGLVEVSGPRISLRPTAGLSLLELEVAAPRRRLVTKALLDRVLGSLMLLFVSPVIAAAALAVRVTSPGPAFYRQTRVGVDGQTFTMWKLRSMYIDADRRREQLAAQSDGNGILFKMRNDPRVTPVGRLLRRYSVDELPQLLNVVRGDMSLVGPRPPLSDEVARYEDAAHRRLRVRPGLTGLWQVSGRSDLSWDESVRLDLRYVDNWSLAMDMLILWKTARAVFAGSGAY